MNPLTAITLNADAETLLREHGVMLVDGEHSERMLFGEWMPTIPKPPSWAVAAAVIEVQTACGLAHGEWGSICERLTSSLFTVGDVLPIVEAADSNWNHGRHLFLGDCRVWEPGKAGLFPTGPILTLPGDPADLVGRFILVNCEQVTR